MLLLSSGCPHSWVKGLWTVCSKRARLLQMGEVPTPLCFPQSSLVARSLGEECSSPAYPSQLMRFWSETLGGCSWSLLSNPGRPGSLLHRDHCHEGPLVFFIEWGEIPIFIVQRFDVHVHKALVILRIGGNLPGNVA